MSLVDHYKKVVIELRRLNAPGVASFIETRLQDRTVIAQLEALSTERADVIEGSEKIKRERKLTFEITDTGNGKLSVIVQIDGAVPNAEALQVFQLSHDIYRILFSDQMQNVGMNTRGSPRVMGFDCTGEMKQLFEAWQQNKKQPGPEIKVG
jgi:hypothetical protein